MVIVHEPPYSSGAVHGPHEDLQWPYEEWGADAVLSGDEHSYERLLKDDDGDGTIVPYFVNGAGGAGLYPFSSDPDPDSAARYNANHGAMLVTATDAEITFEFWSIANGGHARRYVTRSWLPTTRLSEAHADGPARRTRSGTDCPVMPGNPLISCERSPPRHGMRIFPGISGHLAAIQPASIAPVQSPFISSPTALNR